MQKWTEEELKKKATAVLEELSVHAGLNETLVDMVGEEPVYQDAIDVICQLSIKAEVDLLNP